MSATADPSGQSSGGHALGVGSSNTRPSAKSGTPEPVFEAGVDTWRLLFRTSLDHGADVFDLGHYKAHWTPGLGLVAVEGHPTPGRLTPGPEMGAALDHVHELVRGLHPRSEFVGCSRLDATATYEFGTGTEGLAFLAGMASMDWPRLKPVVYGRPGLLETVALTALNSRGRLLCRGYDSGFKRGTHERGEAIRLEEQARFPSGKRPSEFAAAPFARERFEKRFSPLYQSARGVRVASVPVLAQEVVERMIAGDMTVAQAERLIGFTVVAGSGAPYAKSTYHRRKRELRAQGLVLADAFHEPVEVDMGAVLEAALDSPHWGARG
jgi:hypothetical protein